ncbi:TonB-dependent receptor [Brevundimonas variabilis]|uniref:Iron complex outermembrane receptor protein n=1 Tax=Brevundimonas variabilis TaxID=74312 RepID=A0A7W9CKH0_9CAUL|nr:TonB-dependent receptor [Brevundimonas variabilis]MBB5747139.1 iron complex outermembrane receptor protein [Brevundimonas variabilis]
MTNRYRALLATTALFTGVLAAGAASAQSTGTLANETTVDEVVVTGSRGPRSINGAQIAEPVDKARSTITQELITRQQPGQTILQSLNLVPGLNFTNSDPYGNSGGNIRLRGFDGNRVGLAFDGVPLNDTGNYATFTNQQLDPELIERASVTQGSTDVDSPTPAAVGGLINYTSARPLEERGVQLVTSIGTFKYGRVFLRADTGAFGPWGTTAYLTGSYTDYDKFKGPGELEKLQFNGKLYQDLGEGNFGSLAFNYNRNRNAFYNNSTNLVQFNQGFRPENDRTCLPPVGTNGVVDNEATSARIETYFGGIAAGSCTNYSGTRINPSDTGNIRGNFSYRLRDNLRLTVDPSFQYVIANGGGFTLVGERDDRLDQNPLNNAAATNATCVTALIRNTGVDLNGDGDTCDNVALYTPSNTNTRRYGVLTSLIWDVTDNHRLRASYSNDYGRHRQTGEATRYDASGNPPEVFGGENTWGDENLRVFGRDGSFYRSRDRFSLAILNQFSLDYRGQFFDDNLTVQIGVRAPFFKRELNQFCYTANGTGNPFCTTQPVATTLPNGNVQFAGNTTQYIAPFSQDFEYDDVLPNITVGYDFGDNNLFASYSEQIAVPRTDNLYNVNRIASTTAIPIAFNPVQPEITKNYEVGYRYTSSTVIASASAFFNQYSNRVVSTLDNDPTSETFNTFIDRNIGEVESQGFEGAVTWSLADNISLYASATYLDAVLQEDQIVGSFTCPAAGITNPATAGFGCTPNQRSPLIIQTKGKQVVETPEWQATFRADWQPTDQLSLGLQAKWVDERFTTDVNDEVVPAYTVVDFDARYDLTNTFGIRDAYVQFNVSNLLDEEYPINISSGNNALTIADVNPNAGINPRAGQPRTFGLNAPRTMVLTLGTKF